MGKINVYLPQDLEEEVKAADLNVSAVCQSALREALQSPQVEECKHNVIVRSRCEICRETVEIKVPARRKKAS